MMKKYFSDVDDFKLRAGAGILLTIIGICCLTAMLITAFFDFTWSMGGNKVGSMYLYKDTLYYTGVDGIYYYNKDVGNELLVQGADYCFGADGSHIYYICNEKTYSLDLDTWEMRESNEVSQEKILSLYEQAMYNTDEVKKIFNMNPEICSDAPLGVYDGKNTLYVSHNDSRHLNIYHISDKDGEYKAKEISQSALKGSYTSWQSFWDGKQDGKHHFLLNGIWKSILCLLILATGVILVCKTVKAKRSIS